MTAGAVDWHAMAPYAVLAGAMVVATLLVPAATADAAPAKRVAPAVAALAGLTAAAALFVSLVASGGGRHLFGGRFTVDRPAAVAGLVVVLCGYALLLMLERGRAGRLVEPAQSVGIVAAVLGLAGLAAARDAVLCVVALELAATALVLSWRPRAHSDAGPARRARLAGVVALALEAYAVAVLVVVAGTTRLASLGERLHGPHVASAVIATSVFGAALAARAVAAAWMLAATSGWTSGARNRLEDGKVG